MKTKNIHLNIGVGNGKLDNNFYLEHPIIGYEFNKLPRFNFAHSQPIDFAKKKLTAKFIEAVENNMKYLYPLYFKPSRITEEMLDINRWSNLFILNGTFLQKDNNGNVFAYFLIQNNDMAENYLRAFCELYLMVSIDKTKEALEKFNPELYAYMDINFVIEELRKIGVEQLIQTTEE